MKVSAHDMHEMLHREKRRARDAAPDTNNGKEENLVSHTHPLTDAQVKAEQRAAQTGDTAPDPP